MCTHQPVDNGQVCDVVGSEAHRFSDVAEFVLNLVQKLCGKFLEIVGL